MVSIRTATRADRSCLLAFHHSLYVDHHRALVPEVLRPLGAYRDLARALREDVDALLSHPQAIVLLAAEEGADPVGYATGRVEVDERRELSPRGIVEDWYVDEGHRGKGIGTRLLQALLDAFRSRRCEVAESTTWPGNVSALEKHRAAGFVEVEVRLRRRL